MENGKRAARRIPGPLAAIKDIRLEKVKLYHRKDEQIWIEIIAVITEDKRLVIKGNDSGKLVKKLRSNWDYEYYIELESIDLVNLIEKTGNDHVRMSKILIWLKENYEGPEAFSRVKKLLQSLDVRYKESYW